MKISVSVLRGVFLLGVFCSPLMANAGGTLTIPEKAKYVNAKKVRSAIVVECKLPETLSKHIKSFAKSYNKVVMAKSLKGAKGDVLDVKIENAMGHGGGGWGMGSRRTLTAVGKLKRNGKTIGSFTAQRGTTRGRRTCGALQYVSKAVAKDIGVWLAKPTKGARLGE